MTSVILFWIWDRRAVEQEKIEAAKYESAGQGKKNDDAAFRQRHRGPRYVPGQGLRDDDDERSGLMSNNNDGSEPGAGSHKGGKMQSNAAFSTGITSLGQTMMLEATPKAQGRRFHAGLMTSQELKSDGASSEMGHSSGDEKAYRVDSQFSDQ